MRILIVEDDHLQANWIQANLKQAFSNSDSDLIIVRISTEFEFRSHLEHIAKHPPDVIIMDVMLRWTDPDPDMKLPPDDVKQNGFYRAGLRCEKLLAQDERTRNIPIIFYTVLEHIDLKPDLESLSKNVVYLIKKADPDELIRKIRELTHLL